MIELFDSIELLFDENSGGQGSSLDDCSLKLNRLLLRLSSLVDDKASYTNKELSDYFKRCASLIRFSENSVDAFNDLLLTLLQCTARDVAWRNNALKLLVTGNLQHLKSTIFEKIMDEAIVNHAADMRASSLSLASTLVYMSDFRKVPFDRKNPFNQLIMETYLSKLVELFADSLSRFDTDPPIIIYAALNGLIQLTIHYRLSDTAGVSKHVNGPLQSALLPHGERLASSLLEVMWQLRGGQNNQNSETSASASEVETDCSFYERLPSSRMDSQSRTKQRYLCCFMLKQLAALDSPPLAAALWPRLMPSQYTDEDGGRLSSRDLLGYTLSERNPRFRGLLYEALCGFLGQLHSRFMPAEECEVREGAAGSSFVSLASARALELRCLHRRVLSACKAERRLDFKCWPVRLLQRLIGCTPYQRLRSGLLSHSILPGLLDAYHVASKSPCDDDASRDRLKLSVLHAFDILLSKYSRVIPELEQALRKSPLEKYTTEEASAAVMPVTGPQGPNSFAPCWLVKLALSALQRGAVDEWVSGEVSTYEASRVRIQASVLLRSFVPLYSRFLHAHLSSLHRFIFASLNSDRVEEMEVRSHMYLLAQVILQHLLEEKESWPNSSLELHHPVRWWWEPLFRCISGQTTAFPLASLDESSEAMLSSMCRALGLAPLDLADFDEVVCLVKRILQSIPWNEHQAPVAAAFLALSQLVGRQTKAQRACPNLSELVQFQLSLASEHSSQLIKVQLIMPEMALSMHNCVYNCQPHSPSFPVLDVFHFTAERLLQPYISIISHSSPDMSSRIAKAPSHGVSIMAWFLRCDSITAQPELLDKAVRLLLDLWNGLRECTWVPKLRWSISQALQGIFERSTDSVPALLVTGFELVLAAFVTDANHKVRLHAGLAARALVLRSKNAGVARQCLLACLDALSEDPNDVTKHLARPFAGQNHRIRVECLTCLLLLECAFVLPMNGELTKLLQAPSENRLVPFLIQLKRSANFVLPTYDLPVTELEVGDLFLQRLHLVANKAGDFRLACLKCSDILHLLDRNH